MLFWELGLVLIALCICITAFGYNLTLAGYSRKKLLEGTSVNAQMYNRRRIGRDIMRAGTIAAIAVILIFFIGGIVYTTEIREVAPKQVDIMVAQGKTIIIIDGYIHTITGERHHIKRVYFVRKINDYGFEFWQNIVVEDKDQWEVISQ